MQLLMDLCFDAIKGNLEGSCAEELTRDHHPDREDERARIEASGGFVRLVDVHRVIGMMALSRSIGDIHMKRYVTSVQTSF